MTMLDQTTPVRPGTCPAWCATDHSNPGAAGEWHSAQRGAWIDTTGAGIDPDAMLVNVEQFVAKPEAGPAIRVDVDSIGAVAFLTPVQAVQLAKALMDAATQALGTA